MPRQHRGSLAHLEYAGFRTLRAALSRLPLDSAVRIGAAMGPLAMTLDRRNRAVAMRNLEIAFPEMTLQARDAILLGMYRNWGRMAAEWAHFRDLTRSNIAQYVSYEAREHWDEAMRRSAGRGILTFTGHFGNFELLSVGHALYGNPIALVNRPLRNVFIGAEVDSRREVAGVHLIPRQGASRGILRSLHANMMVAIPLDLDVREGVFVDFFSLKACTTDAVARLAMKTGAPVLPAFMVREGSSTRHRITCLPLIDIIRTDDREESARENTQRMMAAFEQMVRRYPEHWNWIHRRWKTRPRGEARFY